MTNDKPKPSEGMDAEQQLIIDIIKVADEQPTYTSQKPMTEEQRAAKMLILLHLYNARRDAERDEARLEQCRSRIRDWDSCNDEAFHPLTRKEEKLFLYGYLVATNPNNHEFRVLREKIIFHRVIKAARGE